MTWSSIANVAGKALPVLGTLLAGPAGGTVGAMIAGALGVDAHPAAVAKALQSPEQVADLQRWAQEHRERLEQIGLQVLQTELADKADARAVHQHSMMPAIVTCSMTVIMAALIAALFSVELPDGNREVAYSTFGTAMTLWVASITYWVGTTRSSADKTRMIGK